MLSQSDKLPIKNSPSLGYLKTAERVGRAWNDNGN